MIASRKVPWPLWTYCSLFFLATTSAEFTMHGAARGKVISAVVMLAWIYFLLRGQEGVWILTVVFSALGFAVGVMTGSISWYESALALLGLGLLLLPVTRRYFSGESAAVAAG